MSASWFSISKSTLIFILTKLKTVFDTKADSSHTHTKSDITDFAHDHPLSIEAASTATSAINLDPNAIYKLTAGGKTFIFKTPADSDHYAWADITGKPSSYPPSAHTHTVSQITDFPSTMPPSSHAHGNIQNGGTLQTNDVAIANGDKLVVTDSSDSAKLARTSLAFDGSTATKCLTQKGTWESFTNNAGTVTSVKVGSTSYTPSSGVVSLPAYPTTLPASDVYAWAKTSSKPSYTLDEVSDGSTRKLANYLPLSGGTLTGTLKLQGNDIWLVPPSSSSNDSADIVFKYGNGNEKMRIWSDDTYTTGKGPNFRLYKSDGTSLGSTRLALLTELTWSNIGDKPSTFTPASHTHGNLQNGGTLQTNDITIASGDKLVVTDSSDSSKIARASISFDGSTATKYLSQKGTWESLTKSMVTSALGYTPPSSDTNNAVTQTEMSDGDGDNYYEVLLSGTADDTTRTEGVKKSNKLVFNPARGIMYCYNKSFKVGWDIDGGSGESTAATVAYLNLGNTTASGTAGNRYGRLRIYSKQSYYSEILTADTYTANRTFTLPDVGGVLVTTSGSQALTNKTYDGYKLAAACAKSVITSSSAINGSGLPTGTAVYNFVKDNYLMRGWAVLSHSATSVTTLTEVETSATIVSSSTALKNADMIKVSFTQSTRISPILITEKNANFFSSMYVNGWVICVYAKCSSDGTLSIGCSHNTWGFSAVPVSVAANSVEYKL